MDTEELGDLLTKGLAEIQANPNQYYDVEEVRMAAQARNGPGDDDDEDDDGEDPDGPAPAEGDEPPAAAPKTLRRPVNKLLGMRKGPYEEASRRNGAREGESFKEGGIAQQIINSGSQAKLREAAESRCPPLTGPSKDAWIQGFIEACKR